MATYPSSLLVKADVINEVDVVDQNDHNILKGEIIALQTYVGTNPHGTKSTFADRMNVMINGSGVINNSSGFSATTEPCKMFYRSDLETLYIRRADNTAWQAIGGSFSNVIFQWNGGLQSTQSGNAVRIISNAFGSTTSTFSYTYLYSIGAGFSTLLTFQWQKISSINTLTSTGRGWTSNNTIRLRLDIGAVSGTSLNNSSTSAETAATYTPFSVDVSGLTNGSWYTGVLSHAGAGADDLRTTELYVLGS